MYARSTKMKFVATSMFSLTCLIAAAQPTALHVDGTVLDPQGHPIAASDTAYPTQLSGTVVDASGAVIAGATLIVRSANGTVQRTTQSDRNGTFIITGLSAGFYRLVISNPNFETKEIQVTIGTT